MCECVCSASSVGSCVRRGSCQTVDSHGFSPLLSWPEAASCSPGADTVVARPQPSEQTRSREWRGGARGADTGVRRQNRLADASRQPDRLLLDRCKVQSVSERQTANQLLLSDTVRPRDSSIFLTRLNCVAVGREHTVCPSQVTHSHLEVH